MNKEKKEKIRKYIIIIISVFVIGLMVIAPFFVFFDK